MGAHAPGQERAPAALRAAGLLTQLPDAVDLGDATLRRWTPDRRHRGAQNAAGVVAAAGEVRDLVARALAGGRRALVLGGDCTVELGVVAAAAPAGLVYFDMHPDLNTPSSVPDGAFDWTGVAHMLDVDGADDRLSGSGPRRPLLSDDDVVFLGADLNQSTAHERSVIAARGLRVMGAQHAARAADGRPHLVHFDVDVIDFSDVPLSENTGRGIGISFEAAFAALDVLVAGDGWLGLTVAELNPHHGAEDGSDVSRFAERLAGALGA